MRGIVALIPARSGSKRIKDKNIRPLGGNPLIAYSIRVAKNSGVFSDVIVSTDSAEYAKIAIEYGASVPFLRPPTISGNKATDIEWVSYTLDKLGGNGDCFAILRPTSPFRTVATIRRAWAQFQHNPSDSLRAVEPCQQHPAKMWVGRDGLMFPFMPFCNNGTPWHDSPYQSLPPVYQQNASLEMARCDTVKYQYSISGSKIQPFMTKGYEGFDINTPEDWDYAEYLISSGKAWKLP